ncbi:uncharacterized protein LOC120455974 [Drosophila santomea]|uniref:uncharacterized protein LOC120455974 n=1 Tax=Drosophila santomea TaxID=129105 RepID=UPI001953D8C7|nr:uncharacterized protein LOC120455974 [Drosophila santomea]
MQISTAILGLFLAFFFSAQTPTSAFFPPPPLVIFCKYFPNALICAGLEKATTPAPSANATSNGTSSAGGQTRSLLPPYDFPSLG